MQPVTKFPEQFLLRLQHQLAADDFADVCRQLSQPTTFGLRINRHLQADNQAAAAVVKQLEALGIKLTPVSWLPTAFTAPIHQRELLLSSSLWPKQVYLQNLSSMVPALLLDPQPSEEVLDMCAAPGSKTLLLAELMQQQGRLAACELVKNRFFKLRSNLAEQGAGDWVETFNTNAEQVGRRQPEQYDRVLLDAPCSSEGRFRADQPDSWKFWSDKKIGDMSRKQKKLFYSAVQALKPGGRLVYSTCTFAPEENESILQHALKKFGTAIEIVPVSLQLDNMRPALTAWHKPNHAHTSKARLFAESVQHARRILPNEQMEGFFVAVVEKRSSTQIG